jgi:hypothetical protein
MQHTMAMLAQQHAARAWAAAPVHAAQPTIPWQVDMAVMQHTMAMLAQQHAGRAWAAAPGHAAQPCFPGQVDVASMQHNVAMASQQHAGRPWAAALAPATAARPPQRKQVALQAFKLDGIVTCSQLYIMFQYGINGSPAGGSTRRRQKRKA